MKVNSLRRLGSLSLLLLSAFLTTKALGQGVVWFDNRPAYLPSPPDRRILGPDGTPLSGGVPYAGTTVSTFYAQLYYQNNFGAWVAHPQAARFFTSSVNAGYWNGGSRTLVNAGSPAPGQSRPVQLQVVVWDGGCPAGTGPGVTYDQARAQGRFWGSSQIFTYTEEWDTPRGTDDTYMKGFGGFWVGHETPPLCDCLGRTGAQLRFLVRPPSPFSSTQQVLLETRTNLTTAPWVPMRTNPGPFWFTNTVSPTDSQRYYRAKWFF